MNPTQDQEPQQSTPPEMPSSDFSSPLPPVEPTPTTMTPTPIPPSPTPMNSPMQPPKKKHTGLIATIIVLIILLAAAVAYILYANTKKTPVAANTSKNSTSNISSTTTPTLSQVATDQVFGSGLSIKYPSTWTDKHTSLAIPSNANSNTDLSGVNDTNVLTSPDGKVSVTLAEVAQGSKPAGTCDNTPGYGSGTLNEYSSSPMSSFSGASLVSYIDSASSQLQYGLGVEASSKATGFSQGGTDCGVGLGFADWSDSTITSSSLSATGAGFGLGVQLTAQLLSLGSAPVTSTFSNVSSTTTQTEIQSALDSSDVTTAKAIMQSLYIKS